MTPPVDTAPHGLYSPYADTADSSSTDVLGTVFDFLAGLSAEAWSALVSAAALIVALWMHGRESKAARFSRGIETISHLEMRFESPDFRETRRRAAVYLLNPAATDVEGNEAVWTVLNFFETVAFLLKRDVIDSETAWQFFAYWFLPYFNATRSLRQVIRQDDPTCFEECDVLYEKLSVIEATKRPDRSIQHLESVEFLTSFLHEEARIPATSSNSPRDDHATATPS